MEQSARHRRPAGRAAAQLDHRAVLRQPRLHGAARRQRPRVGRRPIRARRTRSAASSVDLDAHGSANVFSTFFSYPLLRSVNGERVRDARPRPQAARRSTWAPSVPSDDKNSDVGRLGLSGNLNAREEHHAPSTRASSKATCASSPAAAVGGRSRRADRRLVHEVRVTPSRTRRYRHQADATQVYVALNGQFTSRNLDSSEQMSLGGPYAVRAYATGDGALDEGYVATFELRQSIRQIARARALHAVRLHRYRRRQARAHPFVPGTNHLRLSGGGRRRTRSSRRAIIC